MIAVEVSGGLRLCQCVYSCEIDQGGEVVLEHSGIVDV